MLRSKPWLVSENLFITTNNIRSDILSYILIIHFTVSQGHRTTMDSLYLIVFLQKALFQQVSVISVLSHIKSLIKIIFHKVSLCVQLFKIIFGKVSFLFIGGSKEITVTFSPDHQSDFYSDGARIELFNQV